MCTATSTRAVYTREELLALSRIGRGIKHPILTELKMQNEKAKRDNRRWRYKPFLPSVIMGNANSLPNKCDELEVLVWNQRLYEESSLISLSESWLIDNTPDSCVDIPGFTAIRADRDRSTSGKRKGGGIILFFNQRRVNPCNVTVKERVCCPDIELLSVGFRTFRVSIYSRHRCLHSTEGSTDNGVMSSMLGYRPSILRHSLQSQGISTTYPPA